MTETKAGMVTRKRTRDTTVASATVSAPHSAEPPAQRRKLYHYVSYPSKRDEDNNTEIKTADGLIYYPLALLRVGGHAPLDEKCHGLDWSGESRDVVNEYLNALASPDVYLWAVSGNLADKVATIGLAKRLNSAFLPTLRYYVGICVMRESVMDLDHVYTLSDAGESIFSYASVYINNTSKALGNGDRRRFWEAVEQLSLKTHSPQSIVKQYVCISKTVSNRFLGNLACAVVKRIQPGCIGCNAKAGARSGGGKSLTDYLGLETVKDLGSVSRLMWMICARIAVGG